MDFSCPSLDYEGQKSSQGLCQQALIVPVCACNRATGAFVNAYKNVLLAKHPDRSHWPQYDFPFVLEVSHACSCLVGIRQMSLKPTQAGQGSRALLMVLLAVRTFPRH